MACQYQKVGDRKGSENKPICRDCDIYFLIPVIGSISRPTLQVSKPKKRMKPMDPVDVTIGGLRTHKHPGNGRWLHPGKRNTEKAVFVCFLPLIVFDIYNQQKWNSLHIHIFIYIYSKK